jgi:S1-C subfamily serine protease
MKRSITEFLLTSAVLLCLTAGAAAQTQFPAPEPGHGQGQNPAQPPAPAPRPTVAPIVSESRTIAPQVVTIVHRLNGIKFLRLLQRASGDKKTVAALNNAFGIDEEVHTNILAGLALDDGRTIATWLPQAAAELEASFYFPMMAMPPVPGNPIPGNGAATPSIPRIAPMPPGASHLTVFGRDGKELRARYVGLDGQTGISVLRISGLAFAIPNVETEKAVVLGQKLRLFAPQGATATATAGRVYVRVGESEATVAKIQQLDSGKVQRLVARAANLSPTVVGGIAIDDAGLTVGIIESVSGMEASIIPLSTIRQAAKRVIERQASVPRPFLGIRGEGIGFVPREQLLSNGWTVPAATALLDKRQGIMLTAVVPGTPAALAQLHPGDVILSINEKDIKSAQDFSALLGQCETSVPVKFWVARPSLPNPQAVTVNLVDALNFKHNMEFWFPESVAVQAAKAGRIAVTRDPLVGLGIETIAVDSPAAARLRAQSGLVVVAVDPEGAGYRSGVREGDVIETIDNRISTQRGSGSGAPVVSSQRIVLGVVRNGQRTHITIQKNEQKHEQIKEQEKD